MTPTAGSAPAPDPTPPELRPLAAAADAGDLDTVRQHLRTALADGDPALLVASSQVVATVGGSPVCQRWAVTEPLDPLARAVLAHACALESDEPTAERLLVRVVAEAPDLTLAWTVRTMVGVRMGFDIAEVQRRHRRLLALDPLAFHASDWLVFALASREASEIAPGTALRTAHDLASSAPPGHPLHGLVAIAHLHRGHRDPQHMLRPEVAQDVAASASASVDHPQFGHPVVRNHLYSTFAALGTMLHDPAMTTRYLRRLDAAPDPEAVGHLPFAADLRREWASLQDNRQEGVR